nr:hypothetical protein [Alcaligenes faecalis]
MLDFEAMCGIKGAFIKRKTGREVHYGFARFLPAASKRFSDHSSVLSMCFQTPDRFVPQWEKVELSLFSK